jgi:hypothetical protein
MEQMGVCTVYKMQGRGVKLDGGGSGIVEKSKIIM